MKDHAAVRPSDNHDVMESGRAIFNERYDRPPCVQVRSDEFGITTERSRIPAARLEGLEQLLATNASRTRID